MAAADTEFRPGLEGVIAFETEIAEPDRDGGSLRYRGVDIEELVGRYPFENVWGLLVDENINSPLPPTEAIHLQDPSGSVPADLQAALAAMPSNHLTFLTTAFGKPFVAAGFTNWFREACNAAGLPKGTSAHGLRKAAARRLAEAGCSANVIASITGHKSLTEIERYTKAADQARMARDGMAILIKQRTISG